MLPPAIITALVRFGPFLDDTGVPFVGSVVFTASRPRVWETTGTPVLPRGLVVQLDETGSGEIRLPATDQPGFTDGIGNAVTNWTYKAEVRLSGREDEVRSFALPTDGQTGAVIDLDLLTPVPSSTGVIVALPAVYSVAGESGAVSAQTLAERVGPLLPPSGLDDAGVAAKIADRETATGAAVGRAAEEARAAYDLSQFLIEGEVFPNDGVLNASPLINRAFTALRGYGTFDGRIQELYIPGGTYRLNTSIDIIGDAEYANRLAVRGESRESTVLLPFGNSSVFYTAKAFITPDSPDDFWFFRECHWADLTIDARNQNVSQLPVLLKAFQGGGWLNCTWTRVTAIGTTATMFGTDYPVNCTFTDVWAIDAGRGWTQQTDPVHAAEMRSGFGIGFGHFENESVTFIGGGARGCSRSGFFFERQDSRGSLLRTAKILMVGVSSTGNGNGVTDAGCSGVVAVNCDFSDNKAAGYYVGPNTQAVAAGIDGRLTGCTIMGNGVAGLYATGSIYDDTDPAQPTAGGYVIESCRVEENAAGFIGRLFRTIEGGGLTFRSVRFVRNRGRAIELTGAETPVHDLTIDSCDFDGNAAEADGVAVALMVPMISPRITDNDFANSDGVARQTAAVMFHPAELVTVPRVQRNTWRRHARGLVGAARLDQTLITQNLNVTEALDPAASAAYAEFLFSKPNVVGPTLGADWSASAAGSALEWTRTAGGCRVTSGSWGAVAVQTRDLGTSGLYVESYVHESTQGAGKNRFRGVALGGGDGTAVIAGADDISTQLGAPATYSMWSLSNGTPTLLWSSNVPATEGHRVALGREAGSTVTTMFIDGIAVYTQNLPGVTVSTRAGVAGAAGVAGSSGSTPSNRLIRNVRIVPVTGELPKKTVNVRNRATNPSFEVAGGFSVQAGTGGAATDSRPSDAAGARTGSYSHLVTWTTATTDPSGGGGRITAFEDVEVAKVYTLSVWVKSSRARRYRANLSYFAGTAGTGTFVSSKNGAYVDVPADTWTRLSNVTDPIPAGAISARLDVSAAATANGGTGFQVGDTLRLDDYMATEGTVLHDYFDGSTPGATWVGTPHASASTKDV